MTSLHEAFETLAERAPHPDDLTTDLARTAWRTGRRRRTRRRVRHGLAATATVAVAALVTPVVRDISPAPTSPVSGPVITLAYDSNAVPTAGVRGRLTERAGCLLVAGVPVFWPHGTTWDAAARAVVFDEGSRTLVGQSFSGGGGFFQANADMMSVLGDDKSATRLLRCARAVGQDQIVFAYSGE